MLDVSYTVEVFVCMCECACANVTKYLLFFCCAGRIGVSAADFPRGAAVGG